MDRNKCMTDIWDSILRFNNEYFLGWKNTEEVYYSNALAGEVGEVCNSTKHRTNGGTKNKDVTDYELLEELADCFIYMVLIIEKNGHDITTFSKVIQDKINKNKERMQELRKIYNENHWENL